MRNIIRRFLTKYILSLKDGALELMIHKTVIISYQSQYIYCVLPFDRVEDGFLEIKCMGSVFCFIF